MKLKIFSLLAALSVSVFTSAQASDNDIATKMNSITGFDVVSTSDHVSGLIEIVTDKGIYYSTKDGNYLLSGMVYKFENGLYNLTNEKKAEVAAQTITDIKDTFVTYQAEEEKYELVVFFDTSCGFCQKMHNDMSQYNALGITIHYAMWPRQGVYVPNSNQSMYTQSFMNMQSIVCSANPVMAMNMVMRGTQIQKAECENKIEESYKLGQWLGVQGTPAIYDAQGRLVSRGYMRPNALFNQLERM